MCPPPPLFTVCRWCTAESPFLLLRMLSSRTAALLFTCVYFTFTYFSVAEVFDYWAHASAIDIGEDMSAPDNFESKAQVWRKGESDPSRMFLFVRQFPSALLNTPTVPLGRLEHQLIYFQEKDVSSKLMPYFRRFDPTQTLRCVATVCTSTS